MEERGGKDGGNRFGKHLPESAPILPGGGNTACREHPADLAGWDLAPILR